MKTVVCCVVDPRFFDAGKPLSRKKSKLVFLGFILGGRGHNQHFAEMPSSACIWLLTP